MAKPKYDVSIIVNVHSEGYLLHRTLKSLAANIQNALNANITTEVVIVADRPDAITLEYLYSDWPKKILGDFTIVNVDFGSPGLSRNYGYEVCNGYFAGNLDGDDLWSDSYLLDAINVLKKSKGTMIVHPEYCLSFGIHNELWRMYSSSDETFDPLTMVEGNWWLSSAMARREVFKAVKYNHFHEDIGFSYEDWLWNCDTLQNGYEHHIIPNSVYFYRRKSQASVFSSHKGGLLARTKLWTPMGMQAYLKRPSKALRARKDDEVGSLSQDPTRRSGGYGERVKAVIERYPSIDILLKKTKHHLYILLGQNRLSPVDVNVPDGGSNEFIPDWVKDEWRSIHRIEPLLFPSSDSIARINESKIEPGIYSAVYWQFAEMIDEGVDYLLFTPWLKTGGADLVTCHYANTLRHIHPSANIKVLATEHTDSPWRVKLDPSIEFIQPPRDFHKLNHDQQSKMLAELMVQLAPRKIHIINSQEAFRMIEQYAAQINFKSKIFLSIFAVDRTIEGEIRSAFIAHAEPALPYITKIFTDNQQIIETMVDMYGLKYDMFERHFMPVAMPSKSVTPTNLTKSDTLRILWAASIVKAKRPDILTKIARVCAENGLPVEFYVYGQKGESVSQFTFDTLTSLENVHYGGKFQAGISELTAKSKFDTYLCTSETEGTPNAILEAMAAGLIVVAPKVGGIPEVISHGSTGYLVDEYDDIDQYVSIIQEIIQSNDKLTVSESGKRWVQDTHSTDKFERTLREHPEY